MNPTDASKPTRTWIKPKNLKPGYTILKLSSVSTVEEQKSFKVAQDFWRVKQSSETTGWSRLFPTLSLHMFWHCCSHLGNFQILAVCCRCLWMIALCDQANNDLSTAHIPLSMAFVNCTLHGISVELTMLTLRPNCIALAALRLPMPESSLWISELICMFSSFGAGTKHKNNYITKIPGFHLWSQTPSQRWMTLCQTYLNVHSTQVKFSFKTKRNSCALM